MNKFFKIQTQTLYNFYYKKLDYINLNKNKLIISRYQTIPNFLVNSVFYVHQGKTWVRIKCTKYHVGYKAGMFTVTKKPFFFRSKKKKGKRMLKR